jgi:hypothetical protein
VKGEIIKMFDGRSTSLREEMENRLAGGLARRAVGRSNTAGKPAG